MFASIVFGLAIVVLGHADYPSEPYRLPTCLQPIHYNLTIITDLTDEGNFQFDGEVWIKVKCVESTVRIILHSKELRIPMRKVQLNDEEQNEIDIYEKYLVPEFDFFVIYSQPLMAGKTYILYIPFIGYLDTRLSGYYFRYYYNKPYDSEERIFAATQFEPSYARTVFPCFDEPAMKAVFNISLGHHGKYQAISNMPKVSSTNITERPGFVLDLYKETLRMSTYLTAFFLSEFDHVALSNGSSTVSMNLWCQPQAINQSFFARQIAPELFHYYQDYFEIIYVLPKLDMVATPEFSAEGKGYWGLIMYRESTLLYKENTSTIINKVDVATRISHEIAHQWFGNVVTMDWWTDLWLSEGFATYMAMFSVGDLHPEWESYDLAVADSLLEVYAMDALQASHPISVQIGNPSEVEEIFDTIASKKGGLMVRMLSMVLGEDAFRKGTTCYLTANAMHSIGQDTLWTWLNEGAYRQRSLSPDLSIKTIMDSWTLQSGYPLVRVIRNYDTGTAVVSQNRYFSSDPYSESAIAQCWSVPLSYTTETSMYFFDEMPKEWISCDKPTTVIHFPNANDDWVIFNIRMSGMYIVQYDDQNWDRLLATLNSDNHTKIDPLNRFQLVNDVFDLAFIGEVDYYFAFQVLLYLPEEHEFLPWRAAFSKMEYLHNILHNTSAGQLYTTFAQKWLKPVFERLKDRRGFGSYDDDNSVQVLKFRELVMLWACRLEFSKCIWLAQRSLEKWMATKNPDIRNPIFPEVWTVAFCNALRLAGEDEWWFIFDRYVNSNVATQKDTLQHVLGCSAKPKLLKTYLEWSIDPSSGIRFQDTVRIFRSIALNSPLGFEVAKNYFMENIEIIHYYYGRMAGPKISVYLKTLAERIYTSEAAQDLNDFIAENQKYLSESTMGLKQAMETIQVNILWLERNYDNVKDILTKLTDDTNERATAFSFVE